MSAPALATVTSGLRRPYTLMKRPPRARIELARVERERHPYVAGLRVFTRRIAEARLVIVRRGQHADDGVRLSVELDDFADDIGIGCECAPVKSGAQHDDGGRPLDVLARREITPEHRWNAEQPYEFGGDPHGLDAHRFAAPREIQGAAGQRGNLGEGVVLVLNIEKLPR